MRVLSSFQQCQGRRQGQGDRSVAGGRWRMMDSRLLVLLVLTSGFLAQADDAVSFSLSRMVGSPAGEFLLPKFEVIDVRTPQK